MFMFENNTSFYSLDFTPDSVGMRWRVNIQKDVRTKIQFTAATK